MEVSQTDNIFYIGNFEDPMGKLKFSIVDEKLLLDSVFIAKNLKGQGLASMLVEEAAKFAKQEGYDFIPICSYAIEF